MPAIRDWAPASLNDCDQFICFSFSKNDNSVFSESYRLYCLPTSAINAAAPAPNEAVITPSCFALTEGNGMAEATQEMPADANMSNLSIFLQTFPKSNKP